MEQQQISKQRIRGKNWPDDLWEYCGRLRNRRFGWTVIFLELVNLAGVKDKYSNDYKLAIKFKIHQGEASSEEANVPAQKTIERRTREWMKNNPDLPATHEPVPADQEGQAQSLGQGERLRLKGIMSSMWVPEPDDVPLRGHKHGMGLYEENVNGRAFGWECTTDRMIVWVDEETESWLIEELLPRFSEDNRQELSSKWQGLQLAMSKYLKDAENYHFGIEVRGDHPTIAQVENKWQYGIGEDIEGVDAATKADWKRCWYLLEELPKLRALVTQYKNILLQAIANRS